MSNSTPAPSSSLPFFGGRSRRGSLASISSRNGAPVDKEVLAQALDDIHTSASKSERLTSFHDFDGENNRGPKELVSSGVSGLYNRLKQTVSAAAAPTTKDAKARSKSSESKASLNTASVQSSASSPVASRAVPGLSITKSTPDTASVATPSVPGSPVGRSFSSNEEPAEGKIKSAKLHTSDGQTIPSFGSEDASHTSGSEQQPIKQGKPAQDAPTQEDLDKARSAWIDGDRSEVATDALARVLSHHEASILEPPKQLSKPVRPPRFSAEELDNAIDDSDFAEAPKAPLRVAEHKSMGSATQRQNGVADQEQRADQAAPKRPPMVQVGPSHLPGFEPSRASSTTDGADAVSFSSSRNDSRRPQSDPYPNLNSALQRRRTGLKPPPSRSSYHSIQSHLKRRVLSKEFWMKDENAKVCFSCGGAFTAFRRKHHCRTCGQIFDAKCTTLVNGRQFAQPGTIRLCKPCEEIVLGTDDDDSTVMSEDGDEYMKSPRLQRLDDDEDDLVKPFDEPGFSRTDIEVMAPSIGIPVSRRNREAKRRSAVIEFEDKPHPTLARPSSAHSLISLSRGRSSRNGHRRRHSRHHPARASRLSDERGPFHCDGDGDPKSALPTFHNDNIIDPDLAAFLSDEGSEEDDHPNIASVLPSEHGASPGERERLGFSSLFTSAIRKGRHKTGDRVTASSSTRANREDEHFAQSSRHLPRRLTRSRNLSNGSIQFERSSPRRSKSNLLLNPIEGESLEQRPASPLAAPMSSHAKVVCSSALHTMHSQMRDDIELYPASYEHVRKLLSQQLRDAKIQHSHAWEKALLPVLMQCMDDVEPDVQQGDDMDIRHYIKLKKVPGGRPGDTSYVSGVVFSKNIALKTMSRSISIPRICIVTFSIEYARHEAHFMSLEPVIAQEQEYLENLVNRIAALQPTVLLVQKHVSGLALHLLEKAGITVAYNIKESVLAAVARMTQTTLIRSVDKLGIDPAHLGVCESFDVKTYISDNARKSYIYLSGCEPDLGCTIVLRGADTKTLRSIKRITEFMCYVAYNLKLENYLMRDEFVSIPHTAQSQIDAHNHIGAAQRDPRTATLEKTEKSIRETLGHDIPDGEIHFKYAALEKDTRQRILSASPFVVFMQPHILTQLRDLEQRLTTYKLLRDEYAAADEEGDEEEPDAGIIPGFKLVEPAMVNAPPSKDQPKAVREYLHAVHEDQFEKAKHMYEVQERQWESFVTGEVNPFDPFSHQKIVFLYSTVSSVTSAPCNGPELLGMGFYAGYSRVEPNHDEDIPFGLYIEGLCQDANTPCKDCNKKMYDHHRQYVHGFGQLSVSIQRQPAKLRGYSNTILMWSTCRICRHETTVTQMSDHTWKYSFAKYLELSFWSSPLHSRGGGCKHDIHRDFLRCFGYQDKVVRFQYDAIDIYDVVVPRGRVTWKVEADLTVKNEQYRHFEARLEAFTKSVMARLGTISVDALNDDQKQEAVTLLEKLRQKAEDDRDELVAKLQRKYATSRYFELIPLNRALRFMDEKAIEWDDEFARFEDKYFPSETDIRQIAARQLKQMFAESQPSTAPSVASDLSDIEDSAEAIPSRRPGMPDRHATVDEILAEKAHDVLSSVAEEHKAESDDTDTLRPVKSDESEAGPENELGRVTTPRKDLEEAVKRDDVKHLDLAMPSRSPGDSSTDEAPNIDTVGSPTSSSVANDTSGDEPFAIQPKPLSSGLLERIEQIRSHKAAAGEQIEMVESRIPRLADLKKRDASPRPTAPPLLRAQSQPGHSGHVPRLSDHSIDAVMHSNTSHSGTSERPTVDSSLLHEHLGVGRLANKVGKAVPSLIPRSVSVKGNDHGLTSSTVSALAKHFEQMSREFEKERLKERRQRATRSRQARANPLASSRPVVEVYQNATDAVGEKTPDPEQVQSTKDMDNDRTARQDMDDFVAQAQPEDNAVADGEGNSVASLENDGDSHPPTLAADMDAEATGSGQTTMRPRDSSDPNSSIASPATAPDLTDLGPELTIPEHRKNVWFKYLADFWSKRSASGWANLEYPLHPNEHVFEDSDIIVREDEPSSVIALSLACTDYNNKLKEFRSHPSKAPLAKHGHAHTHSQASTMNVSDERREEIEASLLSDTGTHLKYSFAHGQVKASCKIFYAESFDALRRRCGVADRFMESMSRCLKFDSKGGKTKSLFLRTLDNRFIIKSLQEVELKAFTKFAPDYFNFMSYTLFHGVPSVIAKMFGLFQVNIRNPATGVDFSYYLLVMENLFYERNPNRRFDLKGSMRNRKIESTGQADEVLLDENLVETIFESPLFVREHSRKLLQASVFNDTLWLCKQNVMDYSLMAGFDDDRKELVVGIIDCIRTYTWDKKLESWIKDRGKNKPTITSPKDYRNRFRVSMMQYVLQAPNCWHQFQAQMAPPKTLKEKDEVEETGTGTEMEKI